MAEISFQKENPRILVTRADRIGDLVLSTPVFSELRKKFPNGHIAALTFRENAAILEGNPFLDEVILYDKKGSEKSWLGNFVFSQKLKKKNFDAVIHLHATNRMHTVGLLAGIPVRIGWDRRAPKALTHVFKDTKSEGSKHEAEYNFDLLKPLGVTAPAKPETYFPVPSSAVEKTRALLTSMNLKGEKPLVLFSPGASCPSKRWPAERFGILADFIFSKYGGEFAAVGTRADRPLIEKIKQTAKVPVLDLSGRLDLSMLGALFKNAALVISNDSGPAHIASAVGAPVISIFGRRNPGLSPARWRPLGENSRYVWKDTGCDPCLAHDCQINFLCLDIISSEDVFAQIASVDFKLKSAPVLK